MGVGYGGRGLSLFPYSCRCLLGDPSTIMVGVLALGGLTVLAWWAAAGGFRRGRKIRAWWARIREEWNNTSERRIAA